MGAIGYGSMPLIAGTLQSYAKIADMKAKFNLKKLDPAQERPKAEKTEKEKVIEQITKQMADIQHSNKVSSLDIKLQAGTELTNEELEYLKAENPELYQKAIEIKHERQAYKKELENCKTKEDVEKLNARKMQNFMSEIKAIRSNPNIDSGKKRELLDQINRRVMGILAEHNKFLKTEKYRDLPTEDDILKDKKKSNGKKGPAELADIVIKSARLPLQCDAATDFTQKSIFAQQDAPKPRYVDDVNKKSEAPATKIDIKV